MVRTLYDLSDLKETSFGQPRPRHGLNLLWWFAHECVRIDNGRMIARCNPANGAFGFHRFYNGGGLLPYTNLPYYEVGNLNTTDSLPDYVTENYTGYSDSSNADRIIVSFDFGWNRFNSIYVTRHSDLANFDQNYTYCISLDLLKEIKRLNLVDFLTETMNDPRPYQMYLRYNNYNIHSQSTSSVQSLQGQRSHQSTWDCRHWLICALTCVLLFAVFFLFKTANKV